MASPRGVRDGFLKDRADDSLLTLVGDVPELVRNLVVAEVDQAKSWLAKTAKDYGIGAGWLVGALAVLFWTVGETVIAALATNPEVRASASRFLVFAALAPLLGTPSWLLDGVFIGATRGRDLRNAAIVSTALYIALDLVLRPLGNLGVWLALLASYLLRAGALALYYPALLRSLADAPSPIAPAQKRL